ncbi:hypothetical protein TanjilG_25159 [Lupinus angustifolius]|uniref:BAH domain-containing protein n=1 Tax=Lupinus angustifolius TaxID=3871 RepID=A0A1J7FWF6_LUPAN|nr:PREDICTED: chromatin remodeling protein EBS-like [Lupinus angustifolius]OIV92429.1 hypothetical protein TanjilG_25159 [Lupinus angustifolius]
MAKLRSGEIDIDSYTIKDTGDIIRVGDCVLILPLDTRKPQYVACVEKFEKDSKNNINVHVRWYYRPEEAFGGRKKFHGANELFLSDHYDVHSADAIEGKCVVHPFDNYVKLENAGAKDFYCRFEYKVATGAFTPDSVAVYCKCDMPYNPDIFMVQCVKCQDRFHHACVGMTTEEAMASIQFLCSDCLSNCKEKLDARTFHDKGVSPAIEAVSNMLAVNNVEYANIEGVQVGIGENENIWHNFRNEEHNGNTQEHSQVPTVINPNLEKMVGRYGFGNQAQEFSCSSQSSVNNNVIPVSSSQRVMDVLNNMDGIESGSTLWCETIYLLEDPVRRGMFLAMKNDACRLAWIKFRCNIKDN